MLFRDQIHKDEFEALLEQAEIVDMNKSGIESHLLRRQIAFFYLIALYQQVFEEYEGMKFYVEAYEEISLDGPVYLLDDKISSPKHEYEIMLKFAKIILKGGLPDLDEVPQKMKGFVEEAISFVGTEYTIHTKNNDTV